MIENIGIGLENGKYYVQTCCGEEHLGHKCDCNILIENVSEHEAIKIANKKCEDLNVPIQKWY